MVKGPAQSILVREKEKVAGIWMNAARTRYRSAPSFYAIASSRPIRELVDAFEDEEVDDAPSRPMI